MALDTNRSYTGGRFMLEVDSAGAAYNVGYLKKFSGLHMEADIATHDLSTDNFQPKHVSNIKWTSGKASVGIGMGLGMYEWINAAFQKGYITKSGAFTAADFDYKAQTRLEFQQALITSVTVPKLDGSSKDAAYFDIEFQPEIVRWHKANGEDIRGKIGPKQKAWLCSNFKIELLHLPCDRVSSIDSFTWKCAVAPDPVGGTREYTYHPANVKVPDLKLSISKADHQKWAEAAKKWFIDGHHLEGDEIHGRIVFLGPNMTDELGEITLKNVGFKKFGHDDHEANSEKIARFTVELYVQQMEFHLNTYDA